jgi:hypothetical protein
MVFVWPFVWACRELSSPKRWFPARQNIGSASDWTTTQGLTFTETCDSPTIYAIDALDFAESASDVAAMLFQINHCGELLISGDHWKCAEFGDEDPPKDWKSATFDDSSWAQAGVTGGNGVIKNAPCPIQFWSAKCLNCSIVTRAHVPRQVHPPGACVQISRARPIGSGLRIHSVTSMSTAATSACTRH